MEVSYQTTVLCQDSSKKNDAVNYWLDSDIETIFRGNFLKNICEAAENKEQGNYSSGSRVVMYCSEISGNLLLHDVLLST